MHAQRKLHALTKHFIHVSFIIAGNPPPLLHTIIDWGPINTLNFSQSHVSFMPNFYWLRSSHYWKGNLNNCVNSYACIYEQLHCRFFFIFPKSMYFHFLICGLKRMNIHKEEKSLMSWPTVSLCFGMWPWSQSYRTSNKEK